MQNPLPQHSNLCVVGRFIVFTAVVVASRAIVSSPIALIVVGFGVTVVVRVRLSISFFTAVGTSCSTLLRCSRGRFIFRTFANAFG